MALRRLVREAVWDNLIQPKFSFACRVCRPPYLLKLLVLRNIIGTSVSGRVCLGRPGPEWIRSGCPGEDIWQQHSAPHKWHHDRYMKATALSFIFCQAVLPYQLAWINPIKLLSQPQHNIYWMVINLCNQWESSAQRPLLPAPSTEHLPLFLGVLGLFLRMAFFICCAWIQTVYISGSDRCKTNPKYSNLCRGEKS